MPPQGGPTEPNAGALRESKRGSIRRTAARSDALVERTISTHGRRASGFGGSGDASATGIDARKAPSARACAAVEIRALPKAKAARRGGP